MELVSFAKDVLQNVVEQAASYRLGQSLLRQLDRGLWVVEKCARWAVPPPLDQDERPQPELIRPLPWVFFLMMLIVLRVTRESISLVNLVMGKPPLRSADVVTFFQSKRRYLRTLKYQGNRIMRARTSLAPPRAPWYNSLYKMAELTMCFRRESNYANNNTTRVSNNDEVMVVKRSKRGGQDGSPTVPTNDTMERLIEKMMVDLDAESDEDSCFTLTNVTGLKSDRSDFTIESDPETTLQYSAETPTKQNGTQNGDDIRFSPNNATSSTPEKQDIHNNNQIPDGDQTNTQNHSKNESKHESVEVTRDDGQINTQNHSKNESTLESVEDTRESVNNTSGLLEKSQTDKVPDNTECEIAAIGKFPEKRTLSTKRVSENMILTESQTPRSKIANGRTVKSVPNKRKGPQRERLNSSEVSQSRVLTSNNSF